MDLVLPKQLRLEPLPDNPHRVAAAVGPAWCWPATFSRKTSKGRHSRTAGNPTPRQGACLRGGRPARGKMAEAGARANRAASAPTAWDATGTWTSCRSTVCTVAPYAVYWDLFTPEGWQKQAAEYAAEAERQRRLEAATVAYAQPGEMQPERDFNFQGEDTEPVRLLNRPGPVRRKVVLLRSAGRSGSSHDADRDLSQRRAEEAAPLRLLVGRPPPGGTNHRAERASAVPRDRVRHSCRNDQGQTKGDRRFQATRGNPIGAVYGVRILRADAPR